MAGQRNYSEAEYTRVEGEPLSPGRLASIWGGLPEQDRLGFVLALEESIADRVIELCTASANSPTGKELTQ